MTNWCCNTLMPKGAEEDVEHFMKELHEKNAETSEEFSFAAYVPPPTEANYDWCTEHWGTKWDACDSCVTTSYIHFNTAWAPPEKFLREMSKQYPKVTFNLVYSEEGAGYAGELEVCNGVDLKNIQEEVKGKGIMLDGVIINPGTDVYVSGHKGAHCFLGTCEGDEFDDDYEMIPVEVALNCETILQVRACDVSRHYS